MNRYLIKPFMINVLLVSGALMICFHALKHRDIQTVIQKESVAPQFTADNETFMGPVQELLDLVTTLAPSSQVADSFNPFYTTNYLPPPPVVKEPPPQTPPPPPPPKFKDLEMTYKGQMKSSTGGVAAYIQRLDKLERLRVGDDLGDGLSISHISPDRVELKHQFGPSFVLPFNQLAQLKVPLEPASPE